MVDHIGFCEAIHAFWGTGDDFLIEKEKPRKDEREEMVK